MTETNKILNDYFETFCPEQTIEGEVPLELKPVQARKMPTFSEEKESDGVVVFPILLEGKFWGYAYPKDYAGICTELHCHGTAPAEPNSLYIERVNKILSKKPSGSAALRLR
jgi:hypothetical protein